MRATAITFSLLGPALTFFVGGLVTALAIQGAPGTINSPRGYLVTALAAAPGVLCSLAAVILGLWSARQRQSHVWFAVLGGWAILLIAATAVVGLWFNS